MQCSQVPSRSQPLLMPYNVTRQGCNPREIVFVCEEMMPDDEEIAFDYREMVFGDEEMMFDDEEMMIDDEEMMFEHREMRFGYQAMNLKHQEMIVTLNANLYQSIPIRIPF